MSGATESAATPLRVIGLISGTSVDGVEAVLAEFARDGDVLTCDFLAHRSAPYPEVLRRRILGALPPGTLRMEDVCRLDVEIGQYFAEVAAHLAEEFPTSPVSVVCSHGQTVFHWVEGSRALGTLQLGQPAWIAERTGAAVVSDVRSRDITVGGQGAPLVCVLDVLALTPPPGTVRAALNIGGITNVTVLESEAEPIAFDIGPGNALMDAVVASVSDGERAFDSDGAGARRGKVDPRLLAVFLEEGFYALPPPKSTGKELFNLAYVRAVAGSGIATDDLLATLTALTVETVARALKEFNVTEVVATGGGTRNAFLMERLQAALAGVDFLSLEDFGIPEAAKEALAFALIGYLTASGLPGSVPSCTGASRAPVLGSITPGSRPLSVAQAAMPRSLVVQRAVSEAPER